ncbi:MAG TPA: MFS transporter [Phycisphaerae bacterium]|nr:MFS transporter [Phycisphaerae bacterium]
MFALAPTFASHSTTPRVPPASSTQNSIYASFSAHFWLFTALCIALGAEQFVSAAVGVALPDIAGSFGASPDETSWVMTLYLVGFTVAMPLTPFLSDALGQRLYIGASILTYMLASAGCAFANSLAMLLVMRVIAGMAGATFLVRYVVTSRSRLTPRGRRIGIFFVVLAFAFRGIAPACGGYLTETLNWRWIFLVSIPISALAMVALCFSRETWPPKRHPLPDLFGLTLLVGGIACFCIFLNRAQIDDWFGSRVIILLAIIAAISCPLFIWHQHAPHNRRPLIRLDSLKHRGVLPGMFFALLLGFAMQGGLYLLPHFLRTVARNDAIGAGWMLTIDSAATAVALVFVAAGVILHSSRKWLVLVGVIFAASMLLFAFRQTAETSNASLILPLILRGLALATGLFPLPDLMFREVAEVSFDYLAEARALYYTIRQLGGVIGVAWLAYLLDARESRYSIDLSAHISSLDINTSTALSGIAHGLASRGVPPAQTARGAQLVLKKLVSQQAAILSYQDIFIVLALIGVAMCIAALLFPKIKRPQTAAQRHARSGSNRRSLITR